MVTSAKRSYSQRVVSCQLEVTVGWLLWLVTTFWAASVLSTKFWKYIAVFVIHEQLQQLIPLCVHCPAFCYSHCWLVFIILISQALVPYLFDCLFFVLLVKNTQTTNWGIFVCLFLAFECDCWADFQLGLSLFTFLSINLQLLTLFRMTRKRPHSPHHTQSGDFITQTFCQPSFLPIGASTLL